MVSRMQQDHLVTSAWQGLLERPGANHHIAQVYQDDSFLLEAVGHFIRAGLQQGEGVVLIMRRARWITLATQLGPQGVDLADALRRGQVRYFDAHESLASLMKDGAPDREAFQKVIGSVVGGMRRRYPAVRAFGEMVDILWHDGRRDATAELEKLWNELAAAEPFALLCAYRIDALDCAAYGGPFEGMCNAHTHLISARDYDRFNEAVSLASHDVLDQSTVMMLQSLAKKDKPRTEMPLGQAIILWLSQNMPRTAEKVLARVRAHYSGLA